MASLLGSYTLEPTTFCKYLQRALDFVSWCRRHHQDISTSTTALDSALTGYLHHLFERGGRSSTYKVYANQLLSCLLRVAPHLQGKLPYSAQALEGWNKGFPSVSHPALSWPMVVLIAVTMAVQGRLQHAVATLLAVDCYLRPAEMCGLHQTDVLLPGAGAVRRRAAIIVRAGKRDRNISLFIDRPDVENVLRLYLRSRHRPPGLKLFGFSQAGFYAYFKAVCRQLGLPPDVVPHSLRKTGVTHDSIQGRPFAAIRERGRWRSDRACRVYIQLHSALLNESLLAPPFCALGSLVAGHLTSFFSIALTQF